MTGTIRHGAPSLPPGRVRVAPGSVELPDVIEAAWPTSSKPRVRPMTSARSEPQTRAGDLGIPLVLLDQQVIHALQNRRDPCSSRPGEGVKD